MNTHSSGSEFILDSSPKQEKEQSIFKSFRNRDSDRSRPSDGTQK